MATPQVVEDAGTKPIPPEIRELNARLDYLENLRVEHHTTLRVLTVIAEQLLKHTRADQLLISDQAVRDCGDLEAFRDDDDGVVVIRVAR